MAVPKSILDALNEERGVAASSGQSYHTLKLEKGWSALTRFLPAQLGPRKTWFARIARHWVNRRPIVCIRQTSADFGGDPSAPCILCDLEAKYSSSSDKYTSDEARKMGAFPKWLTYLFVWEMVNERGHRLPSTKEEMYVPNEYWLTRDSFKEISGLWERSLGRVPELGFLDPEHGYDITIMRDRQNGYRHQREEPAPIMQDKSADEMLAFIDEAMKRVKLPDTSLPPQDKIEEAYEKAEDLILGRRVGSRSGESEVDQNDERRPSRRDEPPARSRRDDLDSRSATSRSATSREAPSSDDHQEPLRSDPAPSRRATLAEETPAAREPANRRAAEAPPSRRAEPPPRRAAAPVDNREADYDPVPGHEDSAAGEAETAADTGTDEPLPPVRSSGGTASPSRRSAPPPPARGSRIENDPEELPKERRDAAPAEPRAASTPPAGETHRKLSDNMRSRVSRLGGAPI